MWPFASKKEEPKPVNLFGIYDDPAKVALKVKKVAEEGGPYCYFENPRYEVHFVGEDGFREVATGSIFHLNVDDFVAKATNWAIDAYRKHLMRMAALDWLVEEKLKEV